jgi:hypothetical protein
MDQEAFPEHYAGPLVADARSVMLGLNPGVSYPRYQHREGILAQEIRKEAATARCSRITE